MSANGKPSESDALLNDSTHENDFEDAIEGGPGVTPSLSTMNQKSFYGSYNDIQAIALQNIDNGDKASPSKGKRSSRSLRPSRSFNQVSGETTIMTPADMGRQELYDQIPFSATFGLQKKERSLSQAFSSYASNINLMEQDPDNLLTSDERERRQSYASLVMLDQLEMDKVMVTTPLIFAVCVACMAQFLVGYNTGLMNAPEKYVFAGHSTAMWASAVAAFCLGGPFGAGIAGKTADKRGRRSSLLIVTWIFLVGGLVQTFALDMYSVIIGRFIIGFASGFSSVLVPIYLGELAPPTLRGTLGTLTQFSMVIGILISDLVAFPFAQEWRIMFAVTPVTAALQLGAFSFLLESPRWLLGRDPKSKRARYIIKRLRGCRHDDEVQTEVKLFLSAAKAQDSNDKSSGSSGLREMFQDSNLRFLLISSLILQMAQQLCGINAVFFYSTSFFDGVIDNPLVGTTIVGAVNVVATYVALLLMDSCGRRTLILWSSGGMFLSCVVITLSLMGYFSNIVAVLAVNVYVSFFEIGLGPIPWLIVAEMFDARYVSTAMSAASQLNWACNFFIGLMFPFINEYLHNYSFVPFAIVLLATFVFAFFLLPETQGSTPDELLQGLIRKHSATVYHDFNIEEQYANPLDVEWKAAMEQLKKDEERDMASGTYDYGFDPI